MANHEKDDESILSTGHGLAIGGLFIGMGICIHGGSFLGATWLLVLYIAGFLFALKAMDESKKQKPATERDNCQAETTQGPDKA